MSYDSILRVMLDRLSKEEIINLLIVNIKVVCGDDEKHLKDVTHEILCHSQCMEISAGRLTLDDYQEPHRRELFTRLLSNALGTVLDEKIVSVYYENYGKAKTSFPDWQKTLRR